MSTVRDRMAFCEAILGLKEKKRATAHDASLGFAEYLILDTQFQEIAAEILENPAAFQPWLLRHGVN